MHIQRKKESFLWMTEKMFSRYPLRQPLAQTFRRTALQVLSDSWGQQPSTQSVREQHQQTPKTLENQRKLWPKAQGNFRKPGNSPSSETCNITETWPTQQNNGFKHVQTLQVFSNLPIPDTYRYNFTSWIVGSCEGWISMVSTLRWSRCVPQCFYPVDCRYQIFWVLEIVRR